MQPLHLFVFLMILSFVHCYSFVAVDLENLHRETIMVKSIHTEIMTTQPDLIAGAKHRQPQQIQQQFSPSGQVPEKPQ